jgi:hypothetical protein
VKAKADTAILSENDKSNMYFSLSGAKLLCSFASLQKCEKIILGAKL